MCVCVCIRVSQITFFLNWEDEALFHVIPFLKTRSFLVIKCTSITVFKFLPVFGNFVIFSKIKKTLPNKCREIICSKCSGIFKNFSIFYK